MPRFLLVSLGFYVLSTALGLVLRFGFALPFELPSYSNALHAHSHTLFFGWGTLALFALIFRRLGQEGRQAKALLISTSAISLATFVSFLQGGYSLPSIIISTLSLFLFGWAIALFWRSMRDLRGLEFSFFRAGFIYLGLACVGAIARVVFIATGGSEHQKSLAVSAFLHNFGWFFVFSLTGLLLAEARDLGMRVSETWLRRKLRLAFPLALFAFPLATMGGSQGWLGTLARISSFGLSLALLFGAWAFFRAAPPLKRPGFKSSLRWLGLWLALSAAGSLAGALGMSDLAIRSRHLAILYLHIELVGFLSFGLMTLIAWITQKPFALSSKVHNLGLLVMAAGLLSASVPWLGGSQSPLFAWAGARIAAWGGAMIFLAGVGYLLGARKAPQLVERRRALSRSLELRPDAPRS